MLLPTVWTTRERERERIADLERSRVVRSRVFRKIISRSALERRSFEKIQEEGARLSSCARHVNTTDARLHPRLITFSIEVKRAERREPTDRERGGKNEEDRNDLPISHDQRQPCEGKVYLSRRESARKHLQRPVPRILDRPR